MERPTRRIAHLRPHTTFTQQADGTWRAHFAVLDLAGTGDSEDAAYESLRDVLTAALEDEAVAGRWQAWAIEHHDVVPIPDDEWEEMQETVAKGATASEGLPVLTENTFDDFVAGPGPALVDFWAEWCMPCHMMAPVLRQMADRFAGRLRVGKVNVEENEAIWDKVGSQGLPTLVLYRDGAPVHTIIGFGHTSDELAEEIESHLG